MLIKKTSSVGEADISECSPLVPTSSVKSLVSCIHQSMVRNDWSEMMEVIHVFCQHIPQVSDPETPRQYVKTGVAVEGHR